MYRDLSYKGRGKNMQIKNPVSAYMPGEETRAVTSMVLEDYQHGTMLMNKPRPEFNDRSIIDEINENQKAFNSYVPPRSEDPDESWRAQTIRPLTRNKLISIAAHVTAATLYPNVFAQNRNDEEDISASIVMRDLIEWVIDNSNYAKSFLQAVISALVDPAVIVGVGFYEVMRTVRKKIRNGEYTEKEIIDEALSGFQANIVRCTELLIANIYEPDLQKQRFLIKRKKIDFQEAKLKYGKHENWKYVKPGIVTVWDNATKTFYDVDDAEAAGYLVEEDIYYNRIQDLELTFVNGILLSDSKNPNPREDKLYPFAKSGYEPLNDGQFFYYKSAANKLGSDQQLVDQLYNLILDGAFMALMPAVAIYGSEEVDSSVMIPGMVTSFKDPNTKLQTLNTRTDLRAGLETIGLVERSMSESSQDAMRSGVDAGGDRTAREVMLMEKNAQIALGLFGKMIAFLVTDIGKLMVGDILQHMTVPQIDEITGDAKYSSFLLPDKIENGKKKTEKIEFTNELLGEEDIEVEKLKEMQLDLLEEEGGLDAGKKIYKVNPEIFRTIKYKVTVSADELTPKSKTIERALKIEGFDRLIQLGGIVDQAAVTKDFLLEALAPGESDKYLVGKDNTSGNIQGPGGSMNNKGQQMKGVTSNLLGQITGSNSLGVALSSGE